MTVEPMDQKAVPDRRPLVSVVVATFDAADALTRCIDSVSSQIGCDAEMVVIDGGSTDGTVDIIRAASDQLGYWVSEPDGGVYDAWNKAVARARGDWLCFLGADDRLADPYALARMAPHLRPRPERVAYAITHVVDATGEVAAVMGRPWPETRAALALRMSLPNPSTFYHRALFDEHGRFDTSFRIAGDYEFLLRELPDADAIYVDELVTIMAAGGLSQDPATRPLSAREAARARRMHGLSAWPAGALVELAGAYADAWLNRCFGPAMAARSARFGHAVLRRTRRVRLSGRTGR
jgi:glycosyltransferase involved in cell wall biosynthesis